MMRDLEREASAVAQLKKALGSLLDPDDDKLLLSTIEGETDFHELAVKAIESANKDKADATYISDRIEQLLARQQRLRDRAELTRQRVARAMETAGEWRIPHPTMTISLISGAKRVEVVDKDQIPSEYWVERDPRLSVSELKADLKNGVAVPGVMLVEGPQRIMVRST